jgi:mRNA interferase MazF
MTTLADQSQEILLCKGDLVLINFNPTKGQEMGKLRPAVIISNDLDNQILPTLIVIPLSTVIEPNAMPYRLHIKARDQLLKNSDACINEVRALSKNRVIKRLGKLSANELHQITQGLCDLFKMV